MGQLHVRAEASVKKSLWTAFALVLLAIPVAAMVSKKLRTPALPRYGMIPGFALTDHTGKPFSRADLDGKVAVFDFIFTSCSSACPRLSGEMAGLQRYLRNRGHDARVRLVSISVDPERDTVERLAAHAAGFQADPSLWKLLTGSTQAIQAAVVDGFKTGLSKEKDDSVDGFTIVHGTKLILVDARGTIRGYYDASEPAEMAKLREHVSGLLEKGGA
jgi:protein SCO1/2